MKSFLITVFAVLVLLFIGGAHRTIAADSSDSGPDADWERVAPDPSTSKPDQVLEIPQACTQDGVAVPCDDASNLANDARDSSGDGDDADDIQTVRGGSAGGSPTLGDDNANPDANTDWGSADDYQNEQAYLPVQVPYGMQVPYGIVTTPSRVNRPRTPVPASAYQVPLIAMSHPITSAATPPLRPTGAWMTPPSMTPFARPAGSSMMPAPSFRFH